jgi:hypothetical protein
LGNLGKLLPAAHKRGAQPAIGTENKNLHGE